MAVVAACTSLSALLMKNLVNTAVAGEKNISPLYYPLLISGLFVIKGLFSYLQEISVTKIGGRIVADIQNQLYDHLLRMDVAFFHKRSSSDLITRMTNGANAVRDAINLVAVRLGRDLLTVLGLCAVMVHQDPVLFLIVLTTAPVAALVLRQLSAAAKNSTQGEVGGLTEIISLTRETTQGVRMLKSFQLETSCTSECPPRSPRSRTCATGCRGEGSGRSGERGFERRRDRSGGALRVAEQPQQSGEHRRTVLVHHGPPSRR